MSTRYSLQGMGGIGKSVLASALAHDEGIRQSFQDGIIWITLGKKPDTITHQSQIAYIFEKDPPLFDNASQYKSYLSKILSDKCCLFVLDDVWRIKDTVDFDVLGPDSQMLITTRNENIVTGMGAENFGLDLLEPDQALELLRQASNIAKEKSIPDEAINIAKECGYLPLALSMIGSMLRNKPLNRWKIVLESLLNSDIDKIRFEFANYPYPDLFKALQVSVEELEPVIQKRYHELSIFPEGYYIPESVFEKYWKEEEILNYTHRELIDLFVERSLAHRGIGDGITLHDLQFDYVRKRTNNKIQLHKRIVNAYSQNGSIGWELVPNDGYYQKFLVYHLKNANMEYEAKKAAKTLLLNCFDMHPSVSVRYLKFLKGEVRKIAVILLKEKRAHYSVRGNCLDILGKEAEDYAKILIKDKTSHPYIISRALVLLGEDAADDARHLIKTCDSSEVICQCIKILGRDAIDDAKDLIKYNRSQEVLCNCLDLLGKDAINEAKELLRSSKSHEVLCRCLYLLGELAKDDATVLIKDKFTHPFVICRCLEILDQKALADATVLIKDKFTHPFVICRCLEILDQEVAKKEANVLLLDSTTHPHVLSKCLAILGEDAKTIAIEKLRTWKAENKTLLVRCFQIAADSPEGREAANEMLVQWDKNVPPLLRSASLRASTDIFLRCDRAEEILNTWQRQFRPLVTAALSVYNNQPEQVEKYCRNIVQRFYSEITYQIRKKQKRYDGHILKALSNPYVRIEAETAVKSMMEIEEINPGFLSDLLYEQVNCIIEGDWPLWQPVEES